MSNHENKQLKKLIDINEDACEFYETAQQKAKSSNMKEVFGNLEHLHKGVVINLQQCVRANGGKAEAEETFVGQTAQLWTELMAKISNDVDETFVNHLEEAEDRCLHSIQDTISDESIQPKTRTVLQSELSTLQKSHDYMKSLKDYMKAA